MDKASVFRWALVGVMLLALAATLSSPALAEVEPLPLDQLVPGRPTRAAGWTYTPASEAGAGQKIVRFDAESGVWAATETDAPESLYDWIEYEDASIRVDVSFLTARPAKKKENLPCAVVRIRLADPSQLRTAMSYDSYDKMEFVKADAMAKHVNAVVAVDGDFFKYHFDVGYVVRQGEFYRDALNGKRDLLLIDQNGDFHAVDRATSADAQALIARMESEGLTVINSFSLGPVLVEDGAARDMEQTGAAEYDQLQWDTPQQRVAVCQLGELEYAVVESFGKTDGSCGMTLQEFAAFIAYEFPECRMAYNLDGGGSTNVIVNGKRIHRTPGARDISDILYFASASTEGTDR